MNSLAYRATHLFLSWNLDAHPYAPTTSLLLSPCLSPVTFGALKLRIPFHLNMFGQQCDVLRILDSQSPFLT